MYKVYARRNDPKQPNARGIPFGVVVAVPNCWGGVDIGWSQCSKNDIFNKQRGNRIALGRLQNSPIHTSPSSDTFGADDSWSEVFLETVQDAIDEVESNPKRYGYQVKNNG